MRVLAGILLWIVSFWVVLQWYFIESRCERCRSRRATKEDVKEIFGMLPSKLREKGFNVQETGDKEWTISLPRGE